jgi:hypothetical protein
VTSQNSTDYTLKRNFLSNVLTCTFPADTASDLHSRHLQAGRGPGRGGHLRGDLRRVRRRQHRRVNQAAAQNQCAGYTSYFTDAVAIWRTDNRALCKP